MELVIPIPVVVGIRTNHECQELGIYAMNVSYYYKNSLLVPFLVGPSKNGVCQQLFLAVGKKKKKKGSKLT